MFNMNFGFSVFGLVIFLLPMLINFVYFALPPINTLEDRAKPNRIMEIVEQTTRILYAVVICILVSKQESDFKSPWLYIGLLFLILYYIVWLRYFVGGRDVSLLGKHFLFVSRPLAVFPVVFFIFEAVWLHNYIAVVIMVVFGIAHNLNLIKK